MGDNIPASKILICFQTIALLQYRQTCICITLMMILGYALSIHRLQGDTVKKLILNAGEQEFAMGLLLVGATRTESFEEFAFHHFHNFDHFAKITSETASLKS